MSPYCKEGYYEKFYWNRCSKTIFWLASGRNRRFPNQMQGIKACLKLCQDVRPILIIMEATGGYESLLAATLQAEGWPVAE
jgi:transposase